MARARGTGRIFQRCPVFWVAYWGPDPRRPSRRKRFFESRIGGLGARRLRLDEQMRLLHQQLLELRAREKEAHEEITGRIRVANDELRRLHEGWSALDELTTPIR